MSRLLSIVFKGDLAKLKQEFGRRPESVHDQDAFCQAIGWNKLEIVKEFLARGASPNARDKHGNHPLFMVCLNYGDLRVLDALLAAGSIPERITAGMDDRSLLTAALSSEDQQVQFDEGMADSYPAEDRETAQRLIAFRRETIRIIEQFVQNSEFRGKVTSICRGKRES